MIRLAVDAMSGDRGAAVAVDAVRTCLTDAPDLAIRLVGDEPTLRSHCAKAKLPIDNERLILSHAEEVVTMSEAPATALRHKKRSSMRRAVDLVAAGEADACVSAGNTGALMAMAHVVLKPLDGVDRPAIVSPMPSRHGQTLMLDLGASAEATPEHLRQFALMGSVLAETVYGIDRPRVGLLNIGAEQIKGNGCVQAAGRLLATSGLNYVGFVEGNDIYLGDVDVVVSDGFVGNVALKTSEGLGKLIAQYLREEFSRNLFTRTAALAAMPVLNAFRRRIDPRHYNGASFLGLSASVVKSHGDADAMAFASAIEVARLEAEQQVPPRIRAVLAANAAAVVEA